MNAAPVRRFPYRVPSVTWGLAFGATVLAACSEAKSTAVFVERDDSTGVEIVTNHGGDVPLDWRLEELLRIGGTDDGPEAFGSVQVNADREGNLYVLDTSRHQVLSFDAHGRHRWSVGGRGGGPGELEFPLSFTVSEANVIHVFDPSKTGFVRWNANGELMEGFRLEIPFFGGQLAVLSEGVLFDAQSRTEDAATLQSELRFQPFSAGGFQTLTSIQQRMRGPVSYPGCGITLSGAPEILAPGIIWSASNNRIVSNQQPEYELVVQEGLEIRRVVRRDVSPRRATVRDASLEVPDPMVMRGGAVECRVPASDVVETRGIADHVPTVFQIRISPDGTIWVNRLPMRAEETRIDVFSSTGEYLGTLPGDIPFPAAFTPAGDPIAVDRDELDLPYVVVYRLAPA
jgi:hypothetical protein